MSETTARQSRSFRVGLLLLTTAVSLFAYTCFSVWWPYYQNQRVIAEVERLGGIVETEMFSPWWVPDGVDERHLWLFSRVTWINCDAATMTDAHLERFGQLKSLRVLNLHDGTGAFTDQGIQHLTGLKELQALQLSNASITDAAMLDLTGLTKLEILGLSRTHVTDAGMDHLRKLRKLRILSLDDTPITDHGLKMVSACSELEVLFLDGTQITDAGLQSISGLHKLQELSVERTNITHAGLEFLRGLPHLQFVHAGVTNPLQLNVEQLRLFLGEWQIDPAP